MTPKEILKKFYGYDSFRPGQAEIIDAAMQGRDSLVLMPTGGGKSLCFQIPALARDGFAVVVSPLIALMDDQTAALQANGIPAAAVHSGHNESDNRAVMEALFDGHIKLLYISPERLLQEIDRWSDRMPVNLFAIDEAHCISQWGHDFRPVYTDLARIKQKYPHVPVMALTATADRLCRRDIATNLKLADPFSWTGSFDRPNISLQVVNNPGMKNKMRMIASLIRKHPNDSGVIYCLSRKSAEEMTERINALGFRAVCYHAGMSAAERSMAQKAFINGTVQVVCATIAFGMGIDKSNIRYVVHNNLPSNIESYYQEIGRAGRDGLPAHALLFYSMADMITLRNFAEESGRSSVSNEKLQQMLKFAQAGVCRRRILLSYFGETAAHDCGNCDICLNPPHRFDGTTLAQMALSASIRVGAKAGMYMLNDILRGSLKSDIRRLGFDRIKTFGAGRDLNVAQWNHYLSQMVQLGLFEIAYDESNHLHPTPFGMDVVYGRARIELARYAPEQTKDEQQRRGRIPTLDVPALSPEEELFEQLKTVRMAISQKDGIAPYMVFSDATLQDMARRRPKTVEEMADISGVGERKLVRFGNRFIQAIRKFEGMTATLPQGSSMKQTLILFNSGLPASEIARERGLSESTVYSHIAKLINEDMITQFGTLLTRRQYEDILATRSRYPENYSDHLPERLRQLAGVAMAIYNYQQRHAAARTQNH